MYAHMNKRIKTKKLVSGKVQSSETDINQGEFAFMLK
jgi:hypothetical protein